MDIAAMSIDSASIKLQQQVSMSMLKKTMDSQESQAAALISQMMPQIASPPGVGEHIDVLA